MRKIYDLLFLLANGNTLPLKSQIIFSYFETLQLSQVACNPCKCMDVFKIKHNFYYKNKNN